MIQLTDVYKIYPMGDSEVHAVDGVNLHVSKGEFVAIVGQSGSGKIDHHEYHRLPGCPNLRYV